MGKRKLELLSTLVHDLKEECDMHNFYLARLTREVKREISIRTAQRRGLTLVHFLAQLKHILWNMLGA